jgi:hypothetical protein
VKFGVERDLKLTFYLIIMVKKILIDKSHNSRYGLNDMGGLQSLLATEGIICHELTNGPIKYDKLINYDALFMNPPYSAGGKDILDSEVDEIEKYIEKNDAGLFLLYGSTPFNFWSHDEKLYGSIRLRKIGHIFGISDMVSYDKSVQFNNNLGPIKFHIVPHQITREVKSITQYQGVPLSINKKNAKALIFVEVEGYVKHDTTFFGKLGNACDEEKRKIVIIEKEIFPILAINNDYRVAVMPELGLIYGATYGSIFQDANIDYEDNKELAKRLFKWLCGFKEEIPKPRYLGGPIHT